MKKSKSVFNNIIFFLVFFTIGVLFNEYVDIDLKDGPSIFYYVLFAILTFQISILLHELGHLIFGYLTGYRFLSFRVLSFLILKDKQGKVQFKRYGIMGTLGQCLMVPPNREEIPIFWYNFGGVFLNSLTVLIGFMLIVWGKHDLVTLVGYLLVAINIFFIYLNWVPIKGISNDGKNYREAKKYPASRHAFKEILTLNAQIAYGQRITQMEISVNPEDLAYDKLIQAAVRLFLNTRMLYQKDIEGFSASMKVLNEEIKQKCITVPPVWKLYVYFLLLLENKLNHPIFNNKQLHVLIKRMKYEPFVYVIRYVESVRRNQGDAEDIKKAFYELAEKSHLKGEVLDCIDLLDYLEKEYLFKSNSSEVEQPKLETII